MLKSKRRLSPENMRALAAIASYFQVQECAPTLTELARMLHCSRTAAQYHVKRLYRRGLLVFDRTQGAGYMAARTIRLTDQGKIVASSTAPGEGGK